MNAGELNKLGEFGLIERIQQQVSSAEHLIHGIGDDCSVSSPGAGFELLTSMDLLIEGIHFDRNWISMEELGRKSAAVNISDIAAMGGTPKSLYLGIACPATTDATQMEALARGFIAESERFGAVLAGGDTCRSLGPLLISVTVQGEIEAGRAICRHEAQPGDSIYVSGTVGDSALALKKLMAGVQPDPFLLSRHNTPDPRVPLGRELVQRRVATAMLDVSDGILSDLGHILEASGVGADIELESLPLSPIFRQELATDPSLIDLALAGGEDYELLFTSADRQLAGIPGGEPRITRIGTISAQAGLRVHHSDGRRHQCQRWGYDHFD